MRTLVVVVVAVLGIACASDPSAPLVGTAPDATVSLTAVAAVAGVPPTLTFTREAAQVGLRLTGEIGEIDQLTAEVAPASAPDDARRWRVDAAPPGPDGARGMVTLPSHALTTGDYVLTLWEGDAGVVGRFPFTVVKRP